MTTVKTESEPHLDAADFHEYPIELVQVQHSKDNM